MFSNLNILCVDDEKNALKAYKKLFEVLFNKVFLASSVEEALEIFKKNRIDIVLTDVVMENKFVGIDLIKEIKKIDDDIPVILVTAYENVKLLEDSIDVGVNAFIVKPFKKEQILDALKKVEEKVLYKRRIFKDLEKKVERHIDNEKLAFEKEMKIIKVDTNVVENFKIDIKFVPLEIASGDSFSIRHNCIFIADAMGKGLGPSVTAMIATSFFNYLISRNEDFENLINEFIFFMENNLLDNEALSCGFFSFHKDELFYAIFGLSGFLIQKKNSIKKIKSNNPPLSVFDKSFKFDKISLKDVNKMLFFTDGLVDAITKDGLIYKKYLEEDFLKSNSFEDFEKLVRKRISKQTDDITYLFLKKIDNKIFC